VARPGGWLDWVAKTLKLSLYTVVTAGGVVEVGYSAAGRAAGVGWLQ